MFGFENFGYFFYLMISLLIFLFVLSVTFIYLYIQKTKEIRKYKANESALIQGAYFDPITKLPNKLNIDTVIKEQIVRCTRRNKSFFTAIIKIDSLHEVYNHSVEQEIVIEVAKRLLEIVRTEDLVGYILDGSFVIVFNEYLEETNIQTVLRRVNNLLKKELLIDDKAHKIKVSMGLAKYPDNGQNSHEIIKYALLNRKQ